MREAVGQSLLLSLLFFFIIAIMFTFVGSISYTKAFKIKNRIINIIEEHEKFDSETQADIAEALSNVGYQVSTGRAECHAKQGGTQVYPSGVSGQFDYCVYKYTDSRENVYYGVTTFMKFHFPVIHNLIEFPVYGETKTFGILE